MIGKHPIFTNCINNLLKIGGLSTTLLFTACGGGDEGNGPGNGPPWQQSGDYADLRAMNDDSPFADVLDICANDKDQYECRLSSLPLLGMETEAPTVQNILDRTVISHDWMGTRFAQILNALPADMLKIFGGVTAIVIDDDIRPAYYTISTGAIYLDPAFLWLTVEEANTINPKEDYRSGFDDPLNFRSLFRYVKNGEPAYNNTSFREPVARELNDILLLISNLILHELAHANDFFPPDTLDTISQQQTVLDAALNNEQNWISTRLTNRTPLESLTMYSLAEVMFRGETPTAEQTQLTSVEVGDAFEPDFAADDYAYTSPYEDVAMLFEELMMKYFFGADRDIAFTSAPENEALCSDYIVGWGTRNRVGDNDVKDRAHFVVDLIFPAVVPDAFFQDFALPQALPADVDWCTSIDLEADQNQQGLLMKPQHQQLINPLDLMRPYE